MSLSWKVQGSDLHVANIKRNFNIYKSHNGYNESLPNIINPPMVYFRTLGDEKLGKLLHNYDDNYDTLDDIFTISPLDDPTLITSDLIDQIYLDNIIPVSYNKNTKPKLRLILFQNGIKVTWKEITWNENGSPITLHVIFVSSICEYDEETDSILYSPPNRDVTSFIQHVNEGCAEAQGYYAVTRIGVDYSHAKVYLHKSKFPEDWDFTLKNKLNFNSRRMTYEWFSLNTHGELHLINIDGDDKYNINKCEFILSPIAIMRMGNEMKYHLKTMKELMQRCNKQMNYHFIFRHGFVYCL
jgi:hypothetical protein